MSDDMARLRDEVAGVLAEHERVEQFTKPSRRKGLTEWGARCVCGVELPWVQADRTAAHHAHLADALLPPLARVVAAAKAEALREAADAYDPATEHQARGWVKGWLLDRAEAVGGQNGPLSPAERLSGSVEGDGLGTSDRGAERRTEGEA